MAYPPSQPAGDDRTTSTTQTQRHCCLCGLLCSVHSPEAELCPRRSADAQSPPSGVAGSSAATYPIELLRKLLEPLEEADKSTAEPSRGRVDSEAAESRGQRETLLHRLESSRSPLIRVEGADVQSMRAAVSLAQKYKATIHVASSLGSAAVESVMKTEGWITSTLAEVPANADLIITLGDRLLNAAPMLAGRFFSVTEGPGPPRWLHLPQTEHGELGNSAPQAAVQQQIALAKRLASARNASCPASGDGTPKQQTCQSPTSAAPPTDTFEDVKQLSVQELAPLRSDQWYRLWTEVALILNAPEGYSLAGLGADNDEGGVNPQLAMNDGRHGAHGTPANASIQKWSTDVLGNDPLTVVARQLAWRLLTATRAVILWDVDQFHSPMDRLIVKRLAGIARSLSSESKLPGDNRVALLAVNESMSNSETDDEQTDDEQAASDNSDQPHGRMCHLLPIENDVGRSTAKQTLLWLTGCLGAARWNGTSWQQPRLETGLQSQDLHGEFDLVLSIQGTPCKTASTPSDIDIVFGTTEQSLVGHVTRGDHALFLPVDNGNV